ncbi:MAG: hypothetical protein K8I00_02875 [Candidatus Omnitrophica bacterium]|nr:hypothetical protein [Candidatus Omnitrophota bacterium]
MTEKKQKKERKKLVKFLGGCFAVVAGITMVLVWFGDLAVLIRGSIGFVTALGGLLILYSLKD